MNTLEKEWQQALTQFARAQRRLARGTQLQNLGLRLRLRSDKLWDSVRRDLRLPKTKASACKVRAAATVLWNRARKTEGQAESAIADSFMLKAKAYEAFFEAVASKFGPDMSIETIHGGSIRLGNGETYLREEAHCEEA